jgi:putative DNA primase/helicase
VARAALVLAARGWPVFPCSPATKQPLTPKASAPGKKDGGLYRAVTDRDQVQAWWKDFPAAMIGLRTGAASGFWVLDLDAKKNTGDELLAAVTAFCGGHVAAPDPSRGELLPPPMVRTRSGGYHLYFAMPVDESGAVLRVGNRAKLFDKTDADLILRGVVDTRGDGGYVIAPPSVMRTGGRYTWIARDAKAPLQQAHPRLLDLVLRRGAFSRDAAASAPQLPKVAGPAANGETTATLSARAQAQVAPPAGRDSKARPSEGRRNPGESAEDYAERAYVETALRAEIDAVTALTAGRNNGLNEAACKIGGLIGAGGLTETMARQALEDAAHANGYVAKDGLESARATIMSGLQAGRQSPRDLSRVRSEARRRADARQGRSPSASARAASSSAPSRASSSAAPSRSVAAPSSPPRGVESALPDPPAGAENGERAGAGAPIQTSGGGGETAKKDGGGAPEVDNFALALEPCTDMGNAQRFMARHGWRFLHVREWGWLHYDGKRWSRDGAQGRLERAVQDTVWHIANEVDALEQRPEAQDIVRMERGKPVTRIQNLRDWAIKSQGVGHVSCIAGLALASLERQSGDFDKDLYAFNVQNGTLFFGRTAGKAGYRLRAHDPAHLITKISPATYDPDARCPRYDRFLGEVQPPPKDSDDLSMHRFLHQWAGLSLTGDTSEQKLVFLYGKGRNGKGVWVEAVAHVAGEYAQSTPIETFLDNGRPRRGGEASPELAELAGVRLLRTSEPKKGSKLDDGLIKLVTGGDEMRARFLNKDLFRLIPRFKLTMQGNYRPKIADNSESIWNRIQLVPFPVFFPADKRDPKLLDKLKAESAGVLNRLIEGLQDWMEGGLVPPAAVTEATDAYRSDSDPIGRFLEICTRPTINKRVQSSALHLLYVAWAKANGEFEYTAVSFSKTLSDRGLPKKKADTVWWLDMETIKVPSDFIDERGNPKSGEGVDFDDLPRPGAVAAAREMGVDYDDD